MALHPQVAAFIEVMNQSAQGLDQLLPEHVPAARAAQAAVPPTDPVVVGKVEDRTIPGPAGELPVRIYTPAGSGPFGLLVFYHGGGFVMCSLDTHDDLCRRLCRDAGLVVVSVDYRLAPEARYPAAPDDCYAALCWVAANAAALGGDATRIAVGGDSAGGNLAAVVALRARDAGGPALRHQLLIYPVTCARLETASYRDNGEGYFLSAAMMRWFWNMYLEDPAHGEQPYAAPLRAVDLAGLPPATVLTAEYDPLRDEGEDYAVALAKAGVATWLKRYPGMIHGFVSMPGMIDDAQLALAEITAGLRAALG